MLWRKRMRTDTTLAATFVEHLGSFPWTLGAGPVVQSCANRIEVAAFLQKHSRHIPAVMLDMRLAGVEIPASARSAIERKDTWHELPHLRIDQAERSIFAWRLLHPDFNTFAEVEASINAFSDRFASENGCTCKPVTIDMPVPELGNGWSWHRTVPGDLHHTRIVKAPVKRISTNGDEDEDEFIRGDQARVKKPPVLKAGWIPAEAMTLFVGRPKRGKSLAVAKMASYITAGGTWFDGEPVGPEARGSVLIIEEEDSRAETLARCKAAGCDMSKVHVRVRVPDISNPGQLKKVTDFAENLQNCRLISFSPLQSAIPSADYNEAVVRAKLRPLLRWARGKHIALIGVIHLDKEGKQVAGSDVIVRACRSGLSFDDHPDDKREDEFARRRVMRVMFSNVGKMGTMIPYDTEGDTVDIGGETIDTAKIVFRLGEDGGPGPSNRSADASGPGTPSPAAEPPKRFTPAQRKYIAWLAELIPPLTSGGVPMQGSTVRRLAREHDLGSVDNLLAAADALRIERRRREGAPANEPDLWVPPSEFPAEISSLFRGV
jgi:hypothetical protein